MKLKKIKNEYLIDLEIKKIKPKPFTENWFVHHILMNRETVADSVSCTYSKYKEYIYIDFERF